MGASNRETCNTLELQFNEQGLIPAIVQDVDTGDAIDDGLDERRSGSYDALNA